MKSTLYCGDCLELMNWIRNITSWRKKGLSSMKYKVEFAEFHKIEIEADSKEEAEEKAAVMDDEDILKDSIENSGMVIWEVVEVQK